MQARRVELTHGWLWIKQALGLIFRNPVLSVVFAAVVALVLFAIAKLPLLGPFLALLLLPTLIAGYMRACQAMERHEEAGFAHLLAGFKLHTPRLIALGGISLVSVMSISAAIVAMGGDALVEFLKKAQDINDPEAMLAEMQAAGDGVALAFFVGMLLLLVLQVCLQFAPMRVLFDDETPLAALKSSLVGTLRNVAPYTVYSILLYLLVLALGIFPLPIAFVLVLTLVLTSLYTAYRDIFSAQPQRAAIDGTPPPREDQPR